ncbi:MAG: cytochrome c [Gemmatimonas sp.]
MKTVSLRCFGAAAAAAVLGIATIAYAQSAPPKVEAGKAEAAYKDRDDFMKANAAREKALIAVMKEEAPLDAKAQQAAQEQADAMKQILSKFPAGSGADVVKGSRAKAEIWQQWEKFTQLASAAQTATAASAAAAKTGDAKAFAEKEDASVKACAACHREYRAPRQ